MKDVIERYFIKPQEKRA